MSEAKDIGDGMTQIGPETGDGGPAFPTEPVYGPDYKPDRCNGMSLRQYYAAHAPITIAEAAIAFQGPDAEASYERIIGVLAKMRFAYADAMIKADQT